MTIDWHKKLRAVKTKVWPMAVYGCEATAWSKAIGRQVAAQALNVLLGAHATMRAPELAWAAIEGIEPPDLVILLRRLTAVR
eukprot:3850277-Alexandrium_andersonii.AAC.1